MIADKRLFDGWNSLAAGMDGGRAPNQIEKNQAAGMENIACRGGDPGTRPGFRDHDLFFERPNMTYLASGVFSSVNGISNQSVTNFHNGKFQAASYFAPRGTPECLMVMIGGRQYQVIPRTGRGLDVSEVQLPYRNRSDIPLSYMAQADRFHVTQDGESRPIIFDGVTARRAKDDEVPVGTIMTYGMGRLCVTVNGREIAFGDLYGSHDGREGKRNFTDPGDSVLLFTESTFLNEGFNASIAFSLGAITGLRFAPQQDSSVGDGEMLAFSENGVSSFFLSQPRELWKDSAFQRVTLINIGGRRHLMIVSFNGDLWFRSDDGWRSYRQARAEQQGWAHLPLSTEVRTYLDADTATLLKYGSAINFDNRLIGTCTPRTNQGKVYHNGLTSLDFDVLSSFGQSTKPAWDGHWKKLKFLQLVAGKFHGVNRAFAFAIDAAGLNQIYELSTSDARDFDGPIECQITGRSMDFESPFNEKELISGDIWVDDVQDPVTFTASYRPDQHPDWQTWQTLPVIEPNGTCQAITCGGVPTKTKGFYPRRTITMPPFVCDAQTDRQMNRGYEFQPRLTWTGCCKVRKLRLHAEPLIEDGKARCP
jgi:hypothetical protein